MTVCVTVTGAPSPGGAGRTRRTKSNDNEYSHDYSQIRHENPNAAPRQMTTPIVIDPVSRRVRERVKLSFPRAISRSSRVPMEMMSE